MGVTTSNWDPTQVGLSVVRGQGLTWSQRVRMYNSYVSGNAETLSISSDDSIWDSDSEEEREQKVQEVPQQSQRSYNEHEEHSYFSSVPLSEKCHQSSSRKRTRDDSADEASGEDCLSSPTKLTKVHCRAGDRFMRCIHHVHPGNVFQNGSTAKEEVKISPWQKSDDDNSVLDSSSSAISSDDDETYSRNADEDFYRPKGHKTEDGSEEDFATSFYLHEYGKSKTDRLRSEKNVENASSGPAKYKSAILHRYLCDSTEDAPNKNLKRTHSQRDSVKSEEKLTGKRKRGDSTDVAESKRPKSICDSFSTMERQYSELEAAEVLTNLSRSSNIYKHIYTRKPQF